MPRVTMYLVEVVNATGVVEAVMVPGYDGDECTAVYDRAFAQRPRMLALACDRKHVLTSKPLHWGRMLS